MSVDVNNGVGDIFIRMVSPALLSARKFSSRQHQIYETFHGKPMLRICLVAPNLFVLNAECRD